MLRDFPGNWMLQYPDGQHEPGGKIDQITLMIPELPLVSSSPPQQIAILFSLNKAYHRCRCFCLPVQQLPGRRKVLWGRMNLRFESINLFEHLEWCNSFLVLC